MERSEVEELATEISEKLVSRTLEVRRRLNEALISEVRAATSNADMVAVLVAIELTLGAYAEVTQKQLEEGRVPRKLFDAMIKTFKEADRERRRN